MTIRKATIADIQYIVSIFQNFFTDNQLQGIELYLYYKVKENDYLLSEDNNFLIIFERMGNFKCQVHVYTKPEVRGSSSKKYFLEALDYIKLNNNYTCFFTFILPGHRAAEVAAKYMGFKKQCSIPNAGGNEMDEVLYTLSGGN